MAMGRTGTGMGMGMVLNMQMTMLDQVENGKGMRMDTEGRHISLDNLNHLRRSSNRLK